LQFYPFESAGEESERPVILITQEDDPARRGCPPCPARDRADRERHRLDNTELVLEQGQSGENAVFLAVYFRADAIRVHASFHWQLEPGVPPVVTEDMRVEALKVVESMVDED